MSFVGHIDARQVQLYKLVEAQHAADDCTGDDMLSVLRHLDVCQDLQRGHYFVTSYLRSRLTRLFALALDPSEPSEPSGPSESSETTTGVTTTAAAAGAALDVLCGRALTLRQHSAAAAAAAVSGRVVRCGPVWAASCAAAFFTQSLEGACALSNAADALSDSCAALLALSSGKGSVAEDTAMGPPLRTARRALVLLEAALAAAVLATEAQSPHSSVSVSVSVSASTPPAASTAAPLRVATAHALRGYFAVVECLAAAQGADEWVHPLLKALRESASVLVSYDDRLTAAALDAADSLNICAASSGSARLTVLLKHLLTPELLAAHPPSSSGGSCLRRVVEYIFVEADPSGAGDVLREMFRPSPRTSAAGIICDEADGPLSVRDFILAEGMPKSRAEYMLASCLTQRPVMTAVGFLVESCAYGGAKDPTAVACEVLRYGLPLSRAAAALLSLSGGGTAHISTTPQMQMQMQLLGSRTGTGTMKMPARRTEERCLALDWTRCVVLSARALMNAGQTRVRIRRDAHSESLFATDFLSTARCSLSDVEEDKGSDNTMGGAGTITVAIHRVVFESLAVMMRALSSLLLSPLPQLNSTFLNSVTTMLFEARVSMLECDASPVLPSGSVPCSRRRSAGFIRAHRALSMPNSRTRLHPHSAPLLTRDEWLDLLGTQLQLYRVAERWAAESREAPGHASDGFLPLLPRLADGPNAAGLTEAKRILSMLLGSSSGSGNDNGSGMGEHATGKLHIDDFDVSGAEKDVSVPVLGATVAGPHGAKKALSLSSRISTDVLFCSTSADGDTAVAPFAEDRAEPEVEADGTANVLSAEPLWHIPRVRTTVTYKGVPAPPTPLSAALVSPPPPPPIPTTTTTTTTTAIISSTTTTPTTTTASTPTRRQQTRDAVVGLSSPPHPLSSVRAGPSPSPNSVPENSFASPTAAAAAAALAALSMPWVPSDSDSDSDSDQLEREALLLQRECLALLWGGRNGLEHCGNGPRMDTATRANLFSAAPLVARRALRAKALFRTRAQLCPLHPPVFGGGGNNCSGNDCIGNCASLEGLIEGPALLWRGAPALVNPEAESGGALMGYWDMEGSPVFPYATDGAANMTRSVTFAALGDERGGNEEGDGIVFARSAPSLVSHRGGG